LLAAAGQGLGAVCSRKAYDLSFAAGEQIDGATATFQRLVGGFAITIVFLAVQRAWQRGGPLRASDAPSDAVAVGGPAASTSASTSASVAASSAPLDVEASAAESIRTDKGFRRWRWTLANGLCGPVLGVSCYQWALATTPSGIILPIVATTPLVAIPLAYWIDGERATLRSFIGTAIAVAGAASLTLAR